MSTEQTIDSLPMTPYTLQLQNIFVRQIRAQRTAVPPLSATSARFNVAGVNVENGRGVVVLEVQVDEAPNEIFVSLLAEFCYTEMSDEEVTATLKGGVFNILLPFMREIVHHLSQRMQINPIFLIMARVGEDDKKTALKEPPEDTKPSTSTNVD